jgi:tRNA threonylcarbamoyl adenosine modification protein (Sua5/YciO/YrdC/YwlC family)
MEQNILSQRIELFSKNPDPRLLEIIVSALKDGAVIAYPTDSGFALGCLMAKKAPLERIKKIRNLDEKHHFTLICRDLSEISRFALVDTSIFRLLKRHTPGGYTFVLRATNEVPKLLLQSGKKTIGIRVPDHEVPLSIVEAVGEPILSSTLILPGALEPLKDADDVSDALGDKIDLIISGGYCGFEQTSVVDLSGEYPVVLREGSGETSGF